MRPAPIRLIGWAVVARCDKSVMKLANAGWPVDVQGFDWPRRGILGRAVDATVQGRRCIKS